MLKRLILPLCLGFGLMGLYHNASAQLLYHVDIDTSNLSSAVSYYAEFTLSDGSLASGVGSDANNSVSLSNFTFGGGTPGTLLPPIGFASGNLSTTVLLADGDPGGVADFAQGFTPGTLLDFDVAMTTNVNSGPIPDTFTVKLLDASLNTLATNAPADTPDAFIRVDLNSPTLTTSNVQTYGNTGIPIPPPTITPISGPAASPEPGALGMLIGSVGGSLLAFRRRRTRRTASALQKRYAPRCEA